MAIILAPIATLVQLRKKNHIPGIQGLVADPPNLSFSQECLSTFEQELLGQLYNVFLILVNSSLIANV